MKFRIAQFGDGVVRFLRWFFTREWSPLVIVLLFGTGMVLKYGGLLIVLQVLGIILGVVVAIGGPIWFLVWSHTYMNTVREEDQEAERIQRV